MAEGLQIGELPQKENLTGNELIPFQQGSSNGSMSTALTITKDLGDQVHPNNIGGQKIANVIINTLIRFAPIGLQEPRVEDIFH